MQVPVMSHTLLKQSPGGPASKLFRPKGQQKQSEGEEAQRSCSSSSDMLSSPVAWSGLRCLVPLYSSANQTWFHEDSSYKAPSSGHSGNYYIFGLDCWGFCFFMILSFLLFFFCSNESECSPLSVLLVCCAFLSFSFNTAGKKKKRTRSLSYLNCKKGFWAILCTRKSVLIFIFLWVSPCSWSPDDVLFFTVFIGILHEATCCQSDHVPELCLPLQTWASPIRSVVTLCCPRTQESFSSLFLTALISVSYSWKEMAWCRGAV